MLMILCVCVKPATLTPLRRTLLRLSKLHLNKQKKPHRYLKSVSTLDWNENELNFLLKFKKRINSTWNHRFQGFLQVHYTIELKHIKVSRNYIREIKYIYIQHFKLECFCIEFQLNYKEKDSSLRSLFQFALTFLIVIRKQ